MVRCLVLSDNRLPIYGNFCHFHDDLYLNLQSLSHQFLDSFLIIDAPNYSNLINQNHYYPNNVGKLINQFDTSGKE
ncbi:MULTISPECIES: hypothetical protein, partial [unclassified Gilliamella]|uniref:hypothetical protein n=1 Tax=unclassified Gilliamella TaxID=2685620 RepID=UPI00226A3C1A